jgi:hypothetical protein
MEGRRLVSESPGAEGGPSLRLAVFGESIVSDWGNPAATTWRALLRTLTAAGHDAVFFERRRNRATVELLRARGAEPLRAFAARYPDLHYRTYDLPRGLERSVWFGKEIATLDAVVVLDTAPAEIVDELRAYRTPRLLRLLHQTGTADLGALAADFDLLLTSQSAPDGDALAIGPAVETPVVQLVSPRSGVLVVAYDDPLQADATAANLGSLATRLITPGALALPWEFVPEVALPDLFRAAEVAVVVTSDVSPLAAARFALPLASGCPVLAVRGGGPPLPPVLESVAATTEDVVARIERHRSTTDIPSVPESMRAEPVALGLVERIAAERAARRA